MRDRRYLARMKERLLADLGGRCVDCGALEGLEFAHIAATELSGAPRGRGKRRRLLDVRKNLECYSVRCRPCHDVFDGRTPTQEQERAA